MSGPAWPDIGLFYVQPNGHPWHPGSENDTKAPSQVVFKVEERCKGDAADCESKDLDKDSATR